MGRRKKTKDYNYFLSLPSFNLNSRAKRSIWIVVLLVLGIVSLLGLFNLSGNLGEFLSKWLALIFGYGKILVPILILYFTFLLIRQEKRELKFSDYLGFFLFFLSYQTLFHYFYSSDTWLELAKAGTAGGYVGYYTSTAFFYVFGFWGGTVVLLALLLIAAVLIFNTSLSQIIGKESFLFKFFRPFALFFRELFSGNGKEGGGIDTSTESDEKDSLIAEARDSVLNSWQESSISPADHEVETPNLARQKAKAKTPSQEKIVWPRHSIKIDLPIELLNNKFTKAIGGDTDLNGKKIQSTLDKFGIEVEMGETKVGPTVTQYTFRPAEGVKLSRITTLSNDLSLALAAHPIRIEAPIPGKSLVGVEVPNRAKAIVGLRGILEDDAFIKRKNNLHIVLGKDVAGSSWLYDLSRMPHLLVAGATNSGKSVCLNAIIVSLLYQNNPDDLRFIMVDPKRVELPVYNGIPHLLCPVITEVSKTINSLKWCLNEMDRRYDLLNKTKKKNIQSYNKVSKDKLPYIVFIIDELADFMMTAGKEMEAAIIRLAQMSRAIGIHLILATQRPSVDVITGLIKANIPSRIAFSVASLVDSKTILDASGAEKLLGQGDMLFSTAEISKPKRIQGAYLSDEEINDVVNYIKEKSGEANYLEGITDRQKVSGIAGVGLDGNRGDEDELLEEAKELIVKAGKASTSMLQRRLSIGYGRAAKILDMLEEQNIIGPSNGPKPREVMISEADLDSQSGMTFATTHKRSEHSAPENYFNSEDEGDDGSLDFSGDASPEEDVSAHEEEEEIQEDLVDDQIDASLEISEHDAEEAIEDENEILEDIRSKDKEEEEEEEEKSKLAHNPLDDDDEMFFSK